MIKTGDNGTLLIGEIRRQKITRTTSITKDEQT